MKFYLLIRKREIFTARYACIRNVGKGKMAFPGPDFQQKVGED